MIYHIQGNLLTSDCNFIAHQSNCLMGFGSGIAGQIRKQIPEMYQAFIGDTRPAEEKFGKFSYARTKFGWGFNLYGQYFFGGQDPKGFDTDYAQLKCAMHRMFIIIPELARIKGIKNVKLGMPWKIASALAGGDWEIVYKMIEELSNYHQIDVYLYEYTP